MPALISLRDELDENASMHPNQSKHPDTADYLPQMWDDSSSYLMLAREARAL